uniref:Uncharacterized protein n=1 Tax=Trichogramma kaykai TaxID=54128 RepID=A0ABD2XDE8_9HYME
MPLSSNEVAAAAVTSLLLEAERRKLAVLQRELQIALAEGGSVKVKEKQRQELLHAISKIQAQHQQLDKEYRIHAAGVLLCNSRVSGKLVNAKKDQLSCYANYSIHESLL